MKLLDGGRSIQPCGRGKRRRTCAPHLITGNTDKVEGGLAELLVKMMDDMAQESGKRVGLPDQPQKRPAQDTLDDGVACMPLVVDDSSHK